MSANCPRDHISKLPAWSGARLPARTAMSMIFSSGPCNDETIDMLRKELTAGVYLPDHLERARVVGDAGGMCDATVFLGYWTDPASQQHWLARSQAVDWPGVLVETAIIPKEHWETLHSTPEMTPGVRNLVDIENTDVHEYWGSARDRIPASAGSELGAEPGYGLPGNLCLIRSGQVWSNCPEAERAFYFGEVEPHLRAAVDYLASDPKAGCLSSRLLREQTIDGEDLESTSFLGWFRDLASVERWSRSHPTHLAIFCSYLRMVREFGGRTDLRLWHEMAVVPTGFVRLAGTERSPLVSCSQGADQGSDGVTGGALGSGHGYW